MSNMTPKALFEALLAHPRPPYTVPPQLTVESINPRQCLIRMNGSEVHYDGARWTAYDWNLPAELFADATPEQISAELERVRTFWTQHSNVTDASVWKRKAQELEREKTAAHAYIERMEQALMVFGLNPQNPTIDLRDCAWAYAKGRADEQAMLDKAHEQRDMFRSALNDILTKLGVDPTVGPGFRAKAIDKIRGEVEGLELIAELVDRRALDPDTVRRGVKAVIAERDTAQAHAKELEAKLEALKRERHDETLRSGERIQDLTRRCADLEANAAKLSSTEKPDPTRDYNAEIVAARIDALKTLGVNPYDPPVCVVGAAKRRAKTLEHAEKLEADGAAVWELWGAGREREPGKLHEICQEQERLSSALESKLRIIAEKLDEADIPKRYGDSVDGGPIPVEERVALALTELEECGELMKTYNRQVVAFVGEVDAANAELCRLGAPRKAGDVFLNLVHRIRALPGLLRKD